jgi:hypothetical protein
MDLTDLYKVSYPTTAQYTFFSPVHGTFSKIDHILYQEDINSLTISITSNVIDAALAFPKKEKSRT